MTRPDDVETRIQSGTAENRIVSTLAREHIVPTVPDQHIVQLVAGPGEISETGQREVLNLVPQLIAQTDPDRIGTFTSKLHDDLLGMVQHVQVITSPTHQDIVA